MSKKRTLGLKMNRLKKDSVMWQILENRVLMDLKDSIFLSVYIYLSNFKMSRLNW